MDEFKLPTLTAAQYNEIKSIANEAMMRQSLKDAQSCIDDLRSIERDLKGRCQIKLSELASNLSEYCKRNSDKESYKSFVDRDLYVLHSFVDTGDAQ